MSRDARVGLGTVVAGAVVSLAVSATLLAGGAAVAASAGALDMNDLTTGGIGNARDAWVAAGAAVAAVIGAFVGGRAAAVTSRALVRRDGALAGLLTGSFLAVLGGAAGVWAATAWPASRAAELAWGIFALLALILAGGLIGGMSGARSEARAIGLRAVHRSRRGQEAGESYEREFFGGASLSSGNSTGGSQGIG